MPTLSKLGCRVARFICQQCWAPSSIRWGCFPEPATSWTATACRCWSTKAAPTQHTPARSALRWTSFPYFRIYGLAEWGLGGSIFNQTNQFANTALFDGPNSLERRRLEVQLGQVPPDAYGDIGVTPLTPNTPEYVAAAERFVRTGVLDDDRGNWLEEADYFRVREISVAFDASSFVADVSENTITQASLAFSVRNVALFTTYSGKDVELNNSGTSGIEQGTDFLTLQSPRTLTMSLTLGF